MTDDELAAEYNRSEGSRTNAIVSELDRRDQRDADAATQAKADRVSALYAEKPKTEADRNRVYQGLVNEGEDPEDAWAHANGTNPEAMQKQSVIQDLRAQGHHGASFDALTRDAFKDEIRRRTISAEGATNGYMLGPAGKKAGIDPWSLFTGPESRARKYASPELKEWFDQNGRPTVADFQASLMGQKAGMKPADFYASVTRDDPAAGVELSTISGQLDLSEASVKAHDTASATARATMEQRDDHGRWTRAPGGEGGFHGREATPGGGIQERVQAHIATLAGKMRPRDLDNYTVGPYKREHLNPAYHYTPEQAAAIRDYTAHSAEMNADQRGEPPASRQFPAAKLAAQADQISSAMQPLPHDLVLLRELNGMHRMDDLKQGDVIADDGFASTTLTGGSGRYAAGRDNTTVMHIMTPAGTPSVWTSPAGGDYPEDETILDRGTPMVILRPPTPRPGRSDVTDVYLLAVPKAVVAS
jgi:hypothetical protein